MKQATANVQHQERIMNALLTAHEYRSFTGYLNTSWSTLLEYTSMGLFYSWSIGNILFFFNQTFMFRRRFQS